MVFKISQTFADPANPTDAQRGFPAPGTGAQTTGPWTPLPPPTQPEELQPKGTMSWLAQTIASLMRGGPGVNALQKSVRHAEPSPQPLPVYTPGWVPDFGAAFYAPLFGQVTTNPIGAGIQVMNRVQPSYGVSGQYLDEAIWWTSQVVPTSTHFGPLATPEEILAIVGPLTVEGMVRTTG